MHSFIKAFLTVSLFTTFSRILGFIRDIFIANYLGSTFVADAFFVAFRIPNFFRRVLAEGAYSAALIPVFSGIILNPKNEKEAADFVENTMSFLIITTVLLTIIFFYSMPFVIYVLAPGFTDHKETFNLAVNFGKIIFPYLIFISLVAHFTSIMNVHNKFAVGSFAPAILNISFILSLFIFTPYMSTAGHALSYGVLIGGVLQFILLYIVILKLYRPRIIIPQINDKIKKFFFLFIPGIFGSGVIQLNIIIGTIIASVLPVGAISHIYYADRLNQLPLAIFGIALSIVLLPSLSKAIKQNNINEIHSTQNRSLEFCLLISFPSAVGLFFLAEPIVQILFEHGVFSNNDTKYTANVLALFTLGLPAYIFIKVLVVCFFAREDTKTPLYISIISVLTNIILSLIFINYYREMGIALATAIAAWLNAIILYVIMLRKGNISFDYRFISNFYKIILSTGVMAVFCYLFNIYFFVNLGDKTLLQNAILLLLTIICCIIIYIALIYMLKVLSIKELKGYIKK